MNWKHIVTAAAIAAATICSGCSAASLEQEYNKSEEAIDKFVQSRFSDDTLYRVVRQDGVTRVTILPQAATADRTASASGDTLAPGGTVTFDYAGYIFDSSLPPRQMFATTIRQMAEEAGLWGDDATFSPVTARLSEGELIEGLRRGLRGVTAGEECYIIFSGKYGFGNKSVNAIPKLSPLFYYIKVISLAEAGSK